MRLTVATGKCLVGPGNTRGISLEVISDNIHLPYRFTEEYWNMKAFSDLGEVQLRKLEVWIQVILFWENEGVASSEFTRPPKQCSEFYGASLRKFFLISCQCWWLLTSKPPHLLPGPSVFTPHPHHSGPSSAARELAWKNPDLKMTFSIWGLQLCAYWSCALVPAPIASHVHAASAWCAPSVMERCSCVFTLLYSSKWTTIPHLLR